MWAGTLPHTALSPALGIWEVLSHCWMSRYLSFPAGSHLAMSGRTAEITEPTYTSFPLQGLLWGTFQFSRLVPVPPPPFRHLEIILQKFTLFFPALDWSFVIWPWSLYNATDFDKTWEGFSKVVSFFFMFRPPHGIVPCKGWESEGVTDQMCERKPCFTQQDMGWLFNLKDVIVSASQRHRCWMLMPVLRL